MKSCREAIEDCKLSDLGYKGDRFTWSNNKGGNDLQKKDLIYHWEILSGSSLF